MVHGSKTSSEANNAGPEDRTMIQTIAAVAGVAIGAGVLALAMLLLRGSAFCRP